MRLGWCAAIWLVLFPTLSLDAQQAPPSPLQIAAVQVTGTKRYTQADVARVSGLEPGQRVTVAQIGSAAERLGASGLFKSVNYRYVTNAGRVTVTFEIEEADWTVPVTFDNIVWFTDEEIVQAVKADVPTFDGTLPPTEGIPDLVMRSLQKLLESKKIAGRAAFQPQMKLGSKTLTYLFMVQDPAPVLCGLGFTGASVELQRELVVVSKAAVGHDYSRFYLTSMAAGTLLDVYHRHGYWRASFAPPVTALDSPACTGVSATLSVSEGSAYSFDRAEWSGNAIFKTPELDNLLGMKSGEIADSSKIESGLRRVHSAYGRKGYLQASTSASPRLDDQGKRALFAMSVDEGPQYVMGVLAFEGLSPDDASKLTNRWKLPPGAPYDTSYPSDFVGKEILPLVPRGNKPPLVRESRDSGTHVVNVTIAFQR